MLMDAACGFNRPSISSLHVAKASCPVSMADLQPEAQADSESDALIEE
jgi:hypothetical protein